MKAIPLDGYNLTLADVHDIISGQARALIADKAKQRVERCHAFIRQVVSSDQVMYGINTGFGNFKHKTIAKDQLAQLQLNLVRSHACGVGEPLSYGESLAVVLLRLNCLLRGHSGVSMAVINGLCELLNSRTHAYIPSQGSVGASGDLAPLAHLALVLIGEGEIIDAKGERRPCRETLEHMEYLPLALGPKEGLALINGTPVMTALGALQFIELSNLLQHADIALALSLEGFKGSLRAFDGRIHQLKNSMGQRVTAGNVRLLCRDSAIHESHESCCRVQDPYSFRCAPQVHGSVKDIYHYASAILENEFNSVTDNPLIFAEDKTVLSGGNFHGAAIGYILDFMAIAATDLASICERRIEVLTRAHEAGLPSFLIAQGGLNSGFMIPQVTAAALVSQCKTLAHPASVDTIPTSQEQEDHVSMATNAALKLRRVVANLKHVVAIELFSAAQAVAMQQPLTPGTGTAIAYGLIREKAPFVAQDRAFYKDFAQLRTLIDSRAIPRALSRAGIKIGT